jgi:hypothetical protein
MSIRSCLYTGSLPRAQSRTTWLPWSYFPVAQVRAPQPLLTIGPPERALHLVILCYTCLIISRELRESKIGTPSPSATSNSRILPLFTIAIGLLYLFGAILFLAILILKLDGTSGGKLASSSHVASTPPPNDVPFDLGTSCLKSPTDREGTAICQMVVGARDPQYEIIYALETALGTGLQLVLVLSDAILVSVYHLIAILWC